LSITLRPRGPFPRRFVLRWEARRFIVNLWRTPRLNHPPWFTTRLLHHHPFRQLRWFNPLPMSRRYLRRRRLPLRPPCLDRLRGRRLQRREICRSTGRGRFCPDRVSRFRRVSLPNLERWKRAHQVRLRRERLLRLNRAPQDLECPRRPLALPFLPGRMPTLSPARRKPHNHRRLNNVRTSQDSPLRDPLCRRAQTWLPV